MRAVNLIPGDQRSGGSVGAGRSGGVAYAVLAVVGVVAIMVVLYGKARREIAHKQSQVATLSADAQRVEGESNALAPYTSFASLREQRIDAVDALVDSRFDWAHTFHEFGRVLSSQIELTSLNGTIASATAAAGAAAPAPSATGTSAAASVSSSTPPGSVPTFSLSGCAKSQDDVALMLQRLRLIDGVSEVTLQSSSKSASGSATAGTAASSGGCGASDPVFAATVTFDPLPSTTESAAAAKGSSHSTVSDTAGGAG